MEFFLEFLYTHHYLRIDKSINIYSIY
jgi:hypothetical protein